MAKQLQYVNELHRDFYNLSLEDFPVFASTQGEMIDLIDKWWVSRYVMGDYDEHSQKKPFFNIIRTPVFVAGKMTDIDTKDVRILPSEGQPIEPAMLFQRDLSVWMQETKIAELLNTIKWMRPKYGTVVVKKVVQNGNLELKIVPLQNLRMDATARSLKDSFFVSEWHRFLPEQLRKTAKERGWDKTRTEKVIEENEGNQYIIVWEHYGELSGEKGNFFILSEAPGKRGIILDRDEDKELPYKELHWDKVEGRWLGAGSVEKNAEAQIQLNRSAQLKANALHWTSKHIYQTQDDNIKRNLMTDVKDGDILRSRRGIYPVDVSEKNLHSYREEFMTWTENLNRESFVQDVMIGKTPAAGTPLGTTQLLAAQAGSFFEQKREEFGLFMKELLWDFIIPEFKKNNRKEHWVNFIGASEDELKIIEKIIVGEKTRESIRDFIKTNNSWPFSDELMFIRQVQEEMLMTDKTKWRKIPSGFYDKLKFKIKLVITGESTDLQNKIQALQIAMQTTQDARELRELRARLLQIVGERPVEEEEQMQLTDVAGAQQERQGSPPAVRTPNVGQGLAREETMV